MHYRGTSTMCEAFDKVLLDSDVRILLNIKKINVLVKNIAPDFLSLDDDQPLLVISIESEDEIAGLHFDKYTLKVVSVNDNEVELQFKDKSIWFDINMDSVGSIWSANFDFHIEGNHPDYLNYHIQLLEYDLEWLQIDSKSSKIESVSVSNKEFKQQILADQLNYTLEEVERCSDMLGRAIKKIDIRTGSAFIRLNTDNGRLEPALKKMAENLGFELNSVDETTAWNQERRGYKASHIISLLRNY